MRLDSDEIQARLHRMKDDELREALGAEDYDTAMQYFSALTDHAPDFAEGWNGRATISRCSRQAGSP